MKVLFLGCGTSTGGPVIGCECKVCTSTNPKNNRTRASILIKLDGGNILIDTSTDLRFQALRFGIKRVDAVLYTHAHADHLHGIDELRSFNFLQLKSIPCYGSAKTIRRVKTLFDYIFDGVASSGGKPVIETHVIEGKFDILGLSIRPLKVMHGAEEILGFQCGGVSYLTDCSSLPTETIEQVRGAELVILDALRFKSHPTHMSLEEALDTAEKINARHTVLTHLSHSFDYDEVSSQLPKGVDLAYDGMEITLP